jgi:hypothetical protein
MDMNVVTVDYSVERKAGVFLNAVTVEYSVER